jgi:hypothetical protein
MKHSSRLPLLVCVAFAGLPASLLSLGWVHAQTKPGSEGVGRLIPEKDFDKERDEYKLFQALKKGEPPVNQVNKATIDHGAQWYAYRLTYIEYHQDSDAKAVVPKSMHELVDQALQQIVDPKRALPAQQAYRQEFGKALALRLKEVLKNPKPLVRVNAAIILTRLAETGEDEAGKVLTAVLNDSTQPDAVKLWAEHGLHKLFAVKRANDTPPARAKEPMPDEDAASVVALMNYVGRKVDFPEGTPKEQIAAYHFVRAAGYQALGETRHPAVFKLENKKPKIEAPTALFLLQVMRKAGVTPEPTLTEQVEAAVGVCQLKAKILPDDYQADYVAYQVGQFIAEFADRYNQERQENPSKPSEPWKVHAARLAAALTELQADVERTPAAPYLTKLVEIARPVLNDIRDGKTAPNPANLNNWLGQNPPKSTTVYKGVETSVVKAPEKTGN